MCSRGSDSSSNFDVVGKCKRLVLFYCGGKWVWSRGRTVVTVGRLSFPPSLILRRPT